VVNLIVPLRVGGSAFFMIRNFATKGARQKILVQIEHRQNHSQDPAPSMKKIIKQLALIIIPSLLCVTQQAYSQVIQTVVGNGSAGYSGDGGPATSASLYSPHGIFFHNGQLVIADMNNSAIRYVNSSGYIYSLYSGYYNSPIGVALDGNGYIYVADGDWGMIREFQGGNDPLNLNPNAGLNLTLDSARTKLYCIHEFSNLVTRVSTVVPYGGQPNGVVTIVAGNGTQGYSGDGGPATSAKLNVDSYYFQSGNVIVSAVAVDNQSNVFIADIGNNVIRKVNASGIISTVAGNGTAGFSGDNGQAVSAKLYHPAGVATDTQGNLYIGDAGNHRVRRVDYLTGIITTVAGTGTASYSGDSGAATNATLNSPTGLAFDGSGNLYISDTGNNVIRKVTYSSVTISTSSSPSSGGTTSGGGTKINGSTATLIATPASGYAFVNWTEGGTPVSSTSNYTFTVNGNRTLVANFAVTYTISIANYPSGWGTSIGGGTKISGSSVTVTATPVSGYTFVSWTEGDGTVPAWNDSFPGPHHGEVLAGFQFGPVVSTSASYTFTAGGDRTLTAHFANNNCTGSVTLLLGDTDLDYADITDQNGTEVQHYPFVPGGTGLTETFNVHPGQHYIFNGYTSYRTYHAEFYPVGNYSYIDPLDSGLIVDGVIYLPYYDGDDAIDCN